MPESRYKKAVGSGMLPGQVIVDFPMIFRQSDLRHSKSNFCFKQSRRLSKTKNPFYENPFYD